MSRLSDRIARATEHLNFMKANMLDTDSRGYSHGDIAEQSAHIGRLQAALEEEERRRVADEAFRRSDRAEYERILAIRIAESGSPLPDMADSELRLHAAVQTVADALEAFRLEIDAYNADVMDATMRVASLTRSLDTGGMPTGAMTGARGVVISGVRYPVRVAESIVNALLGHRGRCGVHVDRVDVDLIDEMRSGTRPGTPIDAARSALRRKP